ncbi:MAG: hypothetical protein SAL07_23545 [Oscillatoria sp. PMC 1051.18]|nr:hypothetical protein [Oscillatoria sp. PMC 1050.18]MEC5032887.1 hypothetical protein [Oscillatoria sp. PMC 1051.18]
MLNILLKTVQRVGGIVTNPLSATSLTIALTLYNYLNGNDNYIQVLESCEDLESIREVYKKILLDRKKTTFLILLKKFISISKDLNAALNNTSKSHQYQSLNQVVEHLDKLIQDLINESNQDTLRLLPIATRWRYLIKIHLRELAKAVQSSQEVDNPYIFGVPLNEQVQIFFGRTSIGLRIEKLILDSRRPPLLLYGQRRMGKTSLLNNLGRLLPNSIIPMFIDLQGAPTSATNHAGFLYNLARAMITSAKRQSSFILPSLTRERLETDPFTYFDEWLDEVEEILGENSALLALDEFEALDIAIEKGRFDEQDVLGMLRNLIQHRPRFKVLIAGSHTIEEFQRWASYLINVQVVQISYLQEDEARQLIEQPIPDFKLRYEPDAVNRVIEITRCHPCLVQLLCSEIVALKNEQETAVRRLATVADVEAAIPEALSVGSFFFADLQNNQLDAASVKVLRFIAVQGENARVSYEVLSRQFFDGLDRSLELLLRREVIEFVEGGYCFQVELIRCWFL